MRDLKQELSDRSAFEKVQSQRLAIEYFKGNKRPVVFFDLETTGVNPTKDRIIEISLIKIFTDGRVLRSKTLLNPTVEIPHEAIDIHGISNTMVKDERTFSDVSMNLHKFLMGCDLAGYNIEYFDVPMLVCEFGRCGIEFDTSDVDIFDVCTIFKMLNPRRLEDAYHRFTGQTLADSHTAEADNIATLEVFNGMLNSIDHNRLNEVIQEAQESDYIDVFKKFKANGNDEIVFNFGKHKNELVKDIFKNNPDYIDWLLGSDALEENSKMWLRRITNLERRKG